MKAFIFLLSVALSAGEMHSPVLVWRPTDTDNTAWKLPALPAMSNPQLQNTLDSMDADALVMFIMNELNVEDFSGHPDALPQLQQEFESSQSIFTPSMADASQVAGKLSSFSRVTVDVDDLASLKAAPGARKTLFLVYLNDKPGSDRETVLRRSDDVISQVLAKVKSITKNYSAVLTGKRTTMGGELGRRTVRSLKASAADEQEGFHNFSCVFIYTSSAPSLSFEGVAKPVVLNATYINGTDSSCDNSSSSTPWAKITYSNVPGPDAADKLDTVVITYNFQGKMSKRGEADWRVSSWTLSPVTVEVAGKVGGSDVNTSLTLDFDEVYAPGTFSYHCTSRKWAVKTNTNNGTGDAGLKLNTLELPGFQVQAFFRDGGSSFGRPWDCTPFFTIPIWSGLFLSLILLLVLIWSLVMLATVPTMDRFDDPRGQPLHVPTAE